MPKKKTGQRKKADKQKARQKEIRNKGKRLLSEGINKAKPSPVVEITRAQLLTLKSLYLMSSGSLP